MPIVQKAAPVEVTLVPKVIGDYGVQDGAGEWYAVQVEGLTPRSFAPDTTYVVQVQKNAAGKGHIVKVISGTLLNGTGGLGGAPGPHTGPLPAVLPTPAPAPAAAAPAPSTVKPAATKAVASDPDKMSKAEWAAKDRLVARESAMKSALGSQWVANYLMPLPPEKQKASLFELAAEIEAWFYRP